MAVMDEFKNERESMKDKSFKQKISYFWDYYRWHVIIAVAVVVLGGSLIKDITSHKDYGMYGIFLNAFRMVEDTTPFTDDYIEYANINTDEYTVLFDGNVVMNEDMDENSVNASQMLLVHIAAQDLDVMTMDNYNFIKYAYNQTFMDLRDILTPSQMAGTGSPVLRRRRSFSRN